MCSCIASSRADCVFGVARLISSARHDLGEDRPVLELEDPLAVGRLHDDVRADDVGRHQVGRELDAVEVQVERLGQRADQQRLAQAGHAFEQGVAADEQAGQHAVDDVVVADDHLADLGLGPARRRGGIPRPAACHRMRSVLTSESRRSRCVNVL